MCGKLVLVGMMERFPPLVLLVTPSYLLAAELGHTCAEKQEPMGRSVRGLEASIGPIR